LLSKYEVAATLSTANLPDMPLFDADYPLAPFRDALNSIFGAIFFSILVSAAGAVIPTAVLYWREMDQSYMWGLLAVAWVGNWIMSGIQIWGILFLAINCVLLNCLVHRSYDPLLLLCLIFLNQVFVSTLVIVLSQDAGDGIRVAVAGGVTLLASSCLLFWLWRTGEVRDIDSPLPS
jgi:hypothetical protein